LTLDDRSEVRRLGLGNAVESEDGNSSDSTDLAHRVGEIQDWSASGPVYPWIMSRRREFLTCQVAGKAIPH
jgi:hypothetical protein